MKLPAILLLGSLVLNGACVSALLLRPALAPAAVRDWFTRDAPPSAAARPRAPEPKPAAPAKLWPTLDAGGDLPMLVKRLRSAGFPPEIVRAMVIAELSARYDARLRAFFEPDPTTPFWKLVPNYMMTGDRRMDEYSRLQRERARLQRELLADPFFATDDVTADQRRQFGDLPRQKIDLLQRIEDDYGEMNAAIRSAASGIMLAEDREKLALLARERRADLAAVLSPEELAEYELRSSGITRLLARQLTGFDATEAEFRAIFQAQAAFSEKMGPGAFASGGSMSMEERQAAFHQLNNDLKTKLGPARFADYVRETDSTYQQLARLAEREKLPRDTTLRAFNLRESVAAESARIVDDTAMDTDQKRAALKTLAEQTRTQLLGILGPNAGPAYISVVDQRWLGMVQRGNAVSFGGTSGSMMGSMSGVSSTPVMVSFGLAPSFRSVTQPSPRP